MSGRFVRASKYRHVYGQHFKKELCYENLKPTLSAFDANIIKANGKFLSLNANEVTPVVPFWTLTSTHLMTTSWFLQEKMERSCYGKFHTATVMLTMILKILLMSNQLVL
ncbi:unnamed protein product [Ambrosiozyma monospora]|uniref:Unnamed protein product n=1 Tax=Ambrosiozyma monospora TaxID=43982 RepID=A0ACB5TLZ3_AMBMO|nr:unnamed protein product [Ambrosiozyma monospora]